MSISFMHRPLSTKVKRATKCVASDQELVIGLYASVDERLGFSPTVGNETVGLTAVFIFLLYVIVI